MLKLTQNYQRIWRTAGLLCLAGCAFLVWYAPTLFSHGFSFLPIFLYWSLFLALLGAALFIAFLDIRYIRLQYLLAERALFHETLGTLQQGRRPVPNSAQEKAQVDGRQEEP